MLYSGIQTGKVKCEVTIGRAASQTAPLRAWTLEILSVARDLAPAIFTWTPCHQHSIPIAHTADNIDSLSN